MKSRGRSIQVSAKEAARLQAAFGKQDAQLQVSVAEQGQQTQDCIKGKHPRSSASLEQYQRDHPEDCEPNLAFPGCDNHHLQDPVPCRSCGLETKHLVQLRGITGPLSVTMPECLACATLRRSGTLKRRRKVFP